MTELETVGRAKQYIDKLAKGIDPLTDRPVPDEEVINNVHVSRCLFYVSDLLQQILENGGIQAKPARKNEKLPFSLPLPARAGYDFGAFPVSVSVIAQRLNALVDLACMKKLKSTSITGFLVQTGFLYVETTPNGGKSKRPTQAGFELGISVEDKIGQYGPYTSVLYNRDAQQFILDNLDAIIENNTVPPAENQGKPWTLEDDAFLRNAARTGGAIRDIAVVLKRTRGGVRERMKRLGLDPDALEK